MESWTTRGGWCLRNCGGSGVLERMSDNCLRWVVYLAPNARNGKAYIGMTCDLERRKRDHWLAARSGLRTPFASALRKYGWHAFEFDLLDTFATEAEAGAAERAAIATRRTQNQRLGYNVADGGDGIGSNGAKVVHARPEYHQALMESMPTRHAKAQARKLAEGTNKRAGSKAAVTKRANGTLVLAGRKAAVTRKANLMAARAGEHGPKLFA